MVSVVIDGMGIVVDLNLMFFVVVSVWCSKFCWVKFVLIGILVCLYWSVSMRFCCANLSVFLFCGSNFVLKNVL